MDSPSFDRRRFLWSLATTGLVACRSTSDATATTSPSTDAPVGSSVAVDPASSGPPTSRPTTTAATTTTTTITTTTTSVPDDGFVFDVTRPYWEQGGFAAVTDELESTALVVRGEIPVSLNGLYLRNGSNSRTGRSNHWFLGDGMVHGVTLGDGQAHTFRNRWVRTAPYEANVDLMSPDLPLGPPGGPNGQANVSVFHHAGRLLASGEVGWVYELDPADLSTRGTYDFKAETGPIELGRNVTAHPKIDPATGYLHFFGYSGFEPYLQYYVADQNGILVHQRVIERNQPTMIHDFAITDRDVVFWDFPAVFSFDAFSREEFPYVWQPELGSQVGHMPLWKPTDGTDDTTQPAWIDIDNGFVFHGTNAWRDGDRILVDVSLMPNLADPTLTSGTSQLHRWTIDTAAGSCRQEMLDDLRLDLPTIDQRLVGTAHRRAFYVNADSMAVDGSSTGNLLFNGIVARDVQTGSIDAWRPGPSRQPTEALFVAEDADDPNNADGWLLTYVWNRADDTSSLAILNSGDVAAGPVAEISLPQRVPFGFHGTWVPAT